MNILYKYNTNWGGAMVATYVSKTGKMRSRSRRRRTSISSFTRKPTGRTANKSWGAAGAHVVTRGDSAHSSRGNRDGNRLGSQPPGGSDDPGDQTRPFRTNVNHTPNARSSSKPLSTFEGVRPGRVFVVRFRVARRPHALSVTDVDCTARRVKSSDARLKDGPTSSTRRVGKRRYRGLFFLSTIGRVTV